MNTFQRLKYFSQVWLGSKMSPRLLPQPQPIAASINLTENCQAKCVTCDYWKTEWEDHFDTDKSVDLLNTLGRAGVLYLRFTGGEPLLRRDMFDIMRRAEMDRFLRVSMTTNGLLLKKLHQEINDSPITKITISLDGMQENNDQIRGIRGYFDLAVEGARLLKDKEITIAASINQHLGEDLEGMLNTARDLDADFSYNLLDDRLFFFKNNDLSGLWPDAQSLETVLNALRTRLHRPEYEIDYIRKYYSREELSEPPCILGYVHIFVQSNGEIRTGCLSLPPIGNVLEQSLESIVSSKPYIDQCEAMVQRQCEGCTCGVFTNLKMDHFSLNAETMKEAVGSLGGSKAN